MSDKNPIPLLPCPWCGSDKVEVRWLDELDGNSVVCSACEATGPGFDQNKGNDRIEQLAIIAWNKGPYADRLDIHAKALFDHAKELQDKAAEHLRKADELLKAAATQVKKAKQ